MHLKGVFFPSQEAAAHMGANKSGHIVNITAGIAMQPNAKVPALLPVLIKGGLNSATRGLAIELAASNVKVNAVAPGIIATPMHSQDEATQAFFRTLAPSGTTGVTDDVVNAVLYLTESSFTSGTILPVDGGGSAGGADHHRQQPGLVRVELAAVNQCSGNSRGLFQPRVPGAQWGNGAMGNAKWLGVRLRDILDVAGSEEELGKAVGTDERLGKVTYVSLHGMDRARELAAQSHARAIGLLDGVDGQVDDLAGIADTAFTRQS